MLTNAWTQDPGGDAGGEQHAEAVGGAQRGRGRRARRAPTNSATTSERADEAELLADDGEDEVGVGVRAGSPTWPGSRRGRCRVMPPEAMPDLATGWSGSRCSAESAHGSRKAEQPARGGSGATRASARRRRPPPATASRPSGSSGDAGHEQQRRARWTPRTIVVPRLGWSMSSTATTPNTTSTGTRVTRQSSIHVGPAGEQVGDEQQHGELGQLRRLDARAGRSRASGTAPFTLDADAGHEHERRAAPTRRPGAAGAQRRHRW